MTARRRRRNPVSAAILTPKKVRKGEQRMSSRKCKSDPNESLTKDKNVQHNKNPPGDTQDGKAFEKEQKHVQDARLGADKQNTGGKKCCKKGDQYIPLNTCTDGYEEADRKHCSKKNKKKLKED